MSFKLLLSALAISFVLAGCAGRDVELPENNGSGSDEMRISPCACQPIDYDGGGYKWLG